jgi:hypothetical protein
MKFLVHFLIGTVAASSMMAFNFTAFNVFPYFLKNMTLTETLSASPSVTPTITSFINNFTNSTVGPFENSTIILNSTDATTPTTTPTTTPLNVTNATTTTPLNVTNATTTQLNVTNATTPPPRHSYLRYSRPPTKSINSTPSRTSKYW